MMIAIASDHGGFAMKAQLMEHLTERGIGFDDLGCYSEESVDYPIYAEKAARGVAAGKYDRAVLICGTGIGMSMAANKLPGIRAALCSDCYSAEMTRLHNDSNILCLGGRTIGIELAKRILDIWLDTPFSGMEKHARRIAGIAALEK